MAAGAFYGGPVERAVFGLRELYESYGYEKYRMSKFEEYDLYLEYKSFLPSQHIITFTDLSGRLLALKPDVTLSIAKNIPDQPRGPVKVYYNENVYRSPLGSGEFREIAQVGLECLRDVDLYSQCEVVSLAYESLKCLSKEYMMALSHMGFVSGLLEASGLGPSAQERALKLIEQKNAHEMQRLCDRTGVPEEKGQALLLLPSLYGGFDETLKRAEELVCCGKMEKAVGQLSDIRRVLHEETSEDSFCLDFSVVNDLSYYDSLIFQGFIEGVPRAIISGGRYDRLMERLGKKAKAIGFAVYVNELERLSGQESGSCTDILLIGGGSPEEEVMKAASALRREGKSVRVENTLTDAARAAKIMTVKDGRLEELGGNA